MDLFDRPVVVVDDEDDDISLTTVLLRKAGVSNVPAFRSGEELIAYLGRIQHDAAVSRLLGLILDVKMRGMTGRDVLKWVRERKEFDAVPILMWSSSDDPGDVLAAAQLKAQCYVAKYPTVSALKDILKETVAYHAEPATTRFFKVRSNLLLGREALPDLAVA